MNRHKHLKFIAFLCTLALPSCGPKAPSFSLLSTSTGAYQGSTANNKVDILWVIDNSGSMLTKQQNLSSSFDSFSEVFVDKGFDFRMAIVTTDTRAVGLGGQEAIFQGTPKVLSSSVNNWAATFKTNVVVGSGGDAQAKAIDATKAALSEPLISSSNSNFFRGDAHLAIIMVSDADDNDSVNTPSQLISFLDTVKPARVDAASGQNTRSYTINSVVVDTSNSHNATCPAPYENGVKFQQLSNQTSGTIVSICEANFASGLTNLSRGIAEVITQIPLAREPDVSTINVTFNGLKIPQDSSNGWTYSSQSGHRILFRGSYIPSEGTTINIAYIPKDIIR